MLPTTETARKLPELKMEMLPEGIAGFVFHNARRMDNAPPEYLAVILLSVISGILGESAAIKQQDDAEPASLRMNALVIGDPSSKKSSALQLILKVIKDHGPFLEGYVNKGLPSTVDISRPDEFKQHLKKKTHEQIFSLIEQYGLAVYPCYEPEDVDVASGKVFTQNLMSVLDTVAEFVSEGEFKTFRFSGGAQRAFDRYSAGAPEYDKNTCAQLSLLFHIMSQQAGGTASEKVTEEHVFMAMQLLVVLSENKLKIVTSLV